MTKEIAKKYRRDFQATQQEIKELKEKVKGNMSLIQAREIIWNDIINTMNNVCEFMSIVAEEKAIVRNLESIITTNK